MSRRRRREAISPELTPLIDCVFLLLIFFLVSSVFKKEELALLLNLPTTEEGQGQEQKLDEIIIELSDTKVAINGKEIQDSEIEETLTSFKKETLVSLRVDAEVKYNKLVKVLDVLQKLKLENVSLITQKEDTKIK